MFIKASRQMSQPKRKQSIIQYHNQINTILYIILLFVYFCKRKISFDICEEVSIHFLCFPLAEKENHSVM